MADEEIEGKGFVIKDRRRFTEEGERKEETEWFTVVAWGRLADQCNQFLAKGQRVYAEGRLHTRSWEGQDGQKYHRAEVVANRVLFLERRMTAPLPEEKTAEVGAVEFEPEDIPLGD